MGRVVVIGGGVIGCAVAERLTIERHNVTLLERDQLGSHASGAAAGELSPQTAVPGAQESAIRSLEMFPELVARIENDSGVIVEYHAQQGLLPAFDEDEAAAIKASGGRWLDGAECRRLEPALTQDICGAVLLEHAPGGLVASEWVVIAAGPWSREVGSFAVIDIDVLPLRGQLAALDPGTVSLKHSIFWSAGYLVPKSDGTIIAGSTEEDAGLRRPSNRRRNRNDAGFRAAIGTWTRRRGATRNVGGP